MKRLKEIDSLKGLAALSVLLGHYLGILPIIESNTYQMGFSNPVNVLKYSPLHIIFAGREAVLLFFTLSGFMFAYTYKKKTFNYYDFIIKKFKRILIPSIIMLFFAFILRQFLYEPNFFINLSDWINSKWSQTPNLKNLFMQSTVIVNDNFQYGLNPVIWYLTHELRIALILPFIYSLTKKIGTKLTLLLAIGLSLFGHILTRVSLSNQINIFSIDKTIYFIPAFIIGILSYLNISKLKKINSKFLIFIGIMCYTFSYYSPISNSFLDRNIAIIGCGMIIISVLNSQFLSNILNNKYLVFLGEISYGVYLYHFIILLAMLFIFYNKIPLFIILFVSILISIIFGYISSQLIEKSIKAKKRH